MEARHRSGCLKLDLENGGSQCSDDGTLMYDEEMASALKALEGSGTKGLRVAEAVVKNCMLLRQRDPASLVGDFDRKTAN